MRRITLPSSPSVVDRPFSIAVATNGIGLLTTSKPGQDRNERFFELDLLTGAIRERTDLKPLYLEASGDHSRIVATLGPAGGDHPRVLGGDRHVRPRQGRERGAVDAGGRRHASKMLFGPGVYGWDPATYVLDGDLVRRATIPTGWGLAVDRSGRTGY